jgi:hypothetical protein
LVRELVALCVLPPAHADRLLPDCSARMLDRIIADSDPLTYLQLLAPWETVNGIIMGHRHHAMVCRRVAQTKKKKQCSSSYKVQ